MDHEHREETPILRECQEFSRELLAFATTAARARVRGSVTFLLGCGARSIALFARVPRDLRFTSVQATTAATATTTRRFVEMMSANVCTRQRDETSVTRARIGTTREYADRPAAGTRYGGFAAAAAFDLRLPPSRGNE